MVDYLGYRPNKYTIVLSRAAAFIQRFEITDTSLPDGTTSWIDIYDTEDELLATWHATTIEPLAVEYLIASNRADILGAGAGATYNLYLSYPGSCLPYCWFRGPVVRER